MLQQERYKVLYIDPPWQFRVWNRATGSGRSAESYYHTLSLDDLKALDLRPIMADDCAVLMWVTWPLLKEALELAETWGLTYKTCAFLWAKVNKRSVGRFSDPTWDQNWFMGLGYHTRANTEPCLLFTRGRPKRKSRSVRQFLASAIRRHSQKPDEIYARIEQLFDGPYLEIFARQERFGWTCIGNEIDGSDVRESCKRVPCE